MPMSSRFEKTKGPFGVPLKGGLCERSPFLGGSVGRNSTLGVYECLRDLAMVLESLQILRTICGDMFQDAG